MATRRFNLFDEPWIPVRWLAPADAHASDPLTLSLREVLLRSHEIAGLAVTEPPAHSALLRILYALTARVTGLDEAGPGDWSERRLDVLDAGRIPKDGDGKTVQGVDPYIDQVHDRFYVFDPVGGRPWMQDSRLTEECDPANTAGVNKLIMSRPSGNNHSWFRHDSDAEPLLPTIPEALLGLLTWHYYGASGRCSARNIGGLKSASATAGPLRTSISYHPEGETLFETLLAGLVRPATTVRRVEDQCPWEWETLPDPEGMPVAPKGPCGRLTACSQHVLLLVPDTESTGLVRDCFITWAYRNGRLERDDDYLIWQISQQGNRYPRPADSRRALWRDLDALLLKQAPGAAQPQRPRAFDAAHEVSESLHVRALGFDQDGQAKNTQFVDGSTPPVLGRVEDGVPRIGPAVGTLRSLGERYGRNLDRAVRRAWRTYSGDGKADPSMWADAAASRYWPRAEDEFWRHFRALDRTGTSLDVGLDREAAKRDFLRIAQVTYDYVTYRITRTQRGAKAVVSARVELYGGGKRKT